MGLGNEQLERHSSVTPTLVVPSIGLTRVLADWSGVGSLYGAIANIKSDEPFDRDWTVKDVERRAMRVLLLQCEPLIAQWPSTERAWLDQLPTISTRHRYWSDRPVPRVDWSKTSKRGWPPTSLAIKRRRRASDQVPLAVLRWTLGELSQAVEFAQQLLGGQARLPQLVDESIAPKLQTALNLQDVIDADDLGVPSAEDIAAIRGMGWPWNVIAGVAAIFVSRYQRDGTTRLAQSLISPDGFPDRLFQLAVLGSVLVATEDAGATVRSVRPIGNMTSGPVYRIRDLKSRDWELWCEAERCWDTYGLRDHYYDLASSLSYVNGDAYPTRHLRPDILLALPGVRAMVIECKYPHVTMDPGYVARGVSQAYFYGRQLSPAFPQTQAFVVGPAEIVRSDEAKRIGGIDLHVSSPERIAGWVSAGLAQ
jgi:hypothetical protein